MTPQDIKNYYKTGYKFRKSTGISDANLVNWFKWGYVPEAAQYKIERITKGALKTEWTIEGENMDVHTKSEQLLGLLANSIYDRDPTKPIFFSVSEINLVEKFLNELLHESAHIK